MTKICLTLIPCLQMFIGAIKAQDVYRLGYLQTLQPEEIMVRLKIDDIITKVIK